MKLPNDTIIAEAKITQYLLKFLLEDDKSLFLAQANYTQDNWQQLEKDLREQILPLDATPTEQTRYGNKYEIRDTLTGPNGISLRVVTVWMTEFPSQKTKFITLYPNKEV
ncbi:hypothetical protein Osc7112_2750 [Oscillatoria nigro-viridis PCC 7112]|uniref:DUF6883 domain-containing protein n=1 Tax=Phormidium nigroviride PCC 7112 TaxID=179408 RepID=K9VIW3_9CYAN|nr:DUF6883 domain-containing protein [Oscillatoria nigro-viridis]AFZ07160.1 hypothetical protein Osc7112_2750 [Oscillatoria nigro-viridis PCC 7112]